MNLNKLFLEHCKSSNLEINENQKIIIGLINNFYHLNFKKKSLLNFFFKESEKPGGLRKEWLHECIERFSKKPDVKCISYNHHVNSAYLHEKHIETSIINKNTYMDLDEKKKNNQSTERYSWHTFIVFDV